MKLTDNGISGAENITAWKNAGYSLPEYDREKVKQNTKENPFWIHFGYGNLFRAFQANVVQELLNNKILDRGIIAAEGFDYEIVEKITRSHDDLTLLITLKSNGTVEKTVIGSITESYKLDSSDHAEFNKLKEIFKNKSLQIASFTITEKGYCLTNAQSEFYPDVKSDILGGPEKPQSYIGKVAALLYARFLSGALPIAMVSMDNCSHNGDKLFEAVNIFAEEWEKNNLADTGFKDYIQNPSLVSFPWTMIDKITPRPDPKIEEIIKNDGVEDTKPAVTAKNTYAAPFVNAEECQYLVIEDSFPNGRPPLENGGIIFADRQTVEKVERMKVCTCLNPLHTALAIFGCLLGYRLISDEMKDSALTKLIRGIGYTEGLPVVTDPGIIKPKEFLDSVIEVRLPNPFMPDSPQRIATDTSQKLAIRFGETIKAYQASPGLCASELKFIPIVFAGWIRYLMGIDDNGNEFTPSPDPLLDKVCQYVKGIKIGEAEKAQELLRPLLSDSKIFGVDLYEVGLAEKVTEYFKEMAASFGGVKKTLESVI